MKINRLEREQKINKCKQNKNKQTKQNKKKNKQTNTITFINKCFGEMQTDERRSMCVLIAKLLPSPQQATEANSCC